MRNTAVISLCILFLVLSELYSGFLPIKKVGFLDQEAVITTNQEAATKDQSLGAAVVDQEAPITTTTTKNHSTLDSLVVDCASLQPNLPTDGFYVNATSTFATFTMNIHDPQVDGTVSRHIQDDGCFEKPLVDLLHTAMRKSSQDADPILMDIGGNIGMYSLSTAALGYKVVTFEPFSLNYGRICNSILRNDHFQDRIRLYQAAVSFDATGGDDDVLGIIIPDTGTRNFGAVGIPRDSKYDLSTNINKVEGVDYARKVSLSFLHKQGQLESLVKNEAPIFMKLDIEGGECDALLGSLDMIRATNVVYVQMETSYKRLGPNKSCKEGYDFGDIVKVLASEKKLLPYQYNNKTGELDELSPNGWRTWKQHGDKPIMGKFDVIWKRQE